MLPARFIVKLFDKYAIYQENCVSLHCERTWVILLNVAVKFLDIYVGSFHTTKSGLYVCVLGGEAGGRARPLTQWLKGACGP